MQSKSSLSVYVFAVFGELKHKADLPSRSVLHMAGDFDTLQISYDHMAQVVVLNFSRTPKSDDFS